MIVGLALIGNDVCSGHHDYSHFTPFNEFKEKIVGVLDYLDTVLPPGSHVSTFGLATGTLLYELMHSRVHPLGAAFPQITYERVYDYLNCLEVSPCWGWMNNNATIRNYTQNWANMLSKAYPEIVQEYGGKNGTASRWKNFDIYYWPLDFEVILGQWIQGGGQGYQLIEPVDGFHPSQVGMTLLAEHHLQVLQKNAPHLIPPINPNNDKIMQLFGDQGGY